MEEINESIKKLADQNKSCQTNKDNIEQFVKGVDLFLQGKKQSDTEEKIEEIFKEVLIKEKFQLLD